MPSLKEKIKQQTTKILVSVYFLLIIGEMMLVFSVYLWKTQEARSLDSIHTTTVSKSRTYAGEIEIDYNNIVSSLDRTSGMGVPGEDTTEANWGSEAIFHVSAFNGLKNVAWVDNNFRIRLIVPRDGNTEYLNQIASEVERDPAEINIWVPVQDGMEFKGYIVGKVNAADLLTFVIDDIKNDYMLQLSKEGVTVFTSDNWKNPIDTYAVDKLITLKKSTALNLTFAPTDELIREEITNSRKTLYFGLLFSAISLIAMYYGQNFHKLSKLNELRYRKTLESMVRGCHIISRDWSILFANQPAISQYHFNREDFLGHTIYKCLPGIEESELYQLMQRCMQEGTSHKLIDHYTVPNGSESWTEVSNQPAPDGVLILSSDVSEHKRAELEIAQRVTELERFNRSMVGREKRMIELKGQINDLSQELGKKPPYNLSFLEAEKSE